MCGWLTDLADVRRELRGKDLACWCPLDAPCHADVLLELANAGPNAPFSRAPIAERPMAEKPSLPCMEE
jgi:hypothetical protein